MLVKEDRISTPVGQMSRVVKGEPGELLMKLLTIFGGGKPDLAKVFGVNT